ncbi:hypothetical protein [Nostoc sp.]|uniref:hypothetical protein n=1 Tax=Nostoc sp. TaxID=1180 RepID=UPI002FF74897
MICDRLAWTGTPSHIHYVFSSTLLASCSVRAASRREAMNERCGLLSSSTALGQLRRFVAVLLIFN